MDNALREDIGDGDHTTLATIPAKEKGKARLLVKEKGILAGVTLARFIAHRYDPKLRFKVSIKDGTPVRPGDIAFTISGPQRSILITERLILNFMQRMSGIATLTHRFVQELEGTGCTVADTRKTTPGLRVLEKWAVRIGGGTNHRSGLYDMILIKDNHVDFAGGLPQAISAARNYLSRKGLDLPIVVETRDLGEVRLVLATGGVDRIMLDNFPLPELRKAVSTIGGTFATEASGGITLTTAKKVARCGVDMISVGALTHSVMSMDMSLKAVR